MSNVKYFTSESVSEGHPDKIADQISDAILDSILDEDKYSRVACETLVKSDMVIIAGEITTNSNVDIEKIVRKTVNEIGYNNSNLGFNGNSCEIISIINKQSPDIALGVDCHLLKEQGAGDQGIMYGYATSETDCYMPTPIMFAHQLMQKQADVRKKGILPWLRPDAKCQVTMSYENDTYQHIAAIILSTQHYPDIDLSTLKECVFEEIIKPVIPNNLLTNQSKVLINPTGRFIHGGPLADCGLTGRKIIVDTYGGMARHGGGAFSGKDPTKVDRSAAYAARYVAKNIVAAGIAGRCEIQLSYAIGVAEPISVNVETFGTSKIPEDKIQKLIYKHFDLRPASIINALSLLRPIYFNTARYGHFGRKDFNFPWENLDKVELLQYETQIMRSMPKTAYA